MHILLLLSLFVSSGHSPKHRAMPPFYEITRPGITDTSYLFGTLHLLEGSYVDTMPRVMYALHHSDVVVGEILDTITPDALQDLLSGPPLDSILSPKQYHKVASALRSSSPIPVEFLNSMEPVAVQAIILETMYEKRHPENHKTGIPMDLYFQREAKKHGKGTLALEAATDQEQVLDSIPMTEQIEELMALVEHPKQQLKELDQMLAEYSSGNVEQILDDPEMGALSKDEMQSLLYDRNKKWLDELPAILSRYHCFIAVGAGHLVGKQGLVEGLQQKGYDVKRISPYTK